MRCSSFSLSPSVILNTTLVLLAPQLLGAAAVPGGHYNVCSPALPQHCPPSAGFSLSGTSFPSGINVPPVKCPELINFNLFFPLGRYHPDFHMPVNESSAPLRARPIDVFNTPCSSNHLPFLCVREAPIPLHHRCDYLYLVQRCHKPLVIPVCHNWP